MHTVHGFWLKIKSYFSVLRERDDIFIGAIIIFVGLLSFGLGRLSVPLEESAVRVLSSDVESVAGIDESLSASVILSQNKYVASKRGTKYHAPWCSGAQRIKDANKIWFASKIEAEKAGYSPAANCKGL